MKLIFLLAVLLTTTGLWAQENTVLSFDLTNGSVHRFTYEFDPNIENEKTDFYTGSFDNDYCPLNELPPTENVYPGSQFSIKKQASLDYSIDQYPIRTSIKFFRQEDGVLKQKCSGSLVSRRHVLTACHCVAEINKNDLLYDSLLVCPVFDNGEKNIHFDCSWVDKIYFFQNWNVSYSDVAILELKNPIGEKTGWLGIGFENEDSFLLDGIFYKFSYPGAPFPEVDPRPYNGDTLYYSYGIADIVYENTIMIKGTSGIPGESGSSLIKVNNENDYTSYGTLSFSNYLSHCRLTAKNYFGLKAIIENDLVPTGISQVKVDEVMVYPNPVIDKIKISNKNGSRIKNINLFDSLGHPTIRQQGDSPEIEIDIRRLPKGIYILDIETENSRIVKKIMKSSH